MKHSLWIRMAVLLSTISIAAEAALGPRHVEAAAGFSYQPPAGWVLTSAPGSGLHMAVGVEGIEAGASLVVEASPLEGPISETIGERRSELTTDGFRLASDAVFSTASGLAGHRLIAAKTEDGETQRQNVFVFSGGAKKYVVTGTAMGEEASKLDPLFEESLKTFEVVGGVPATLPSGGPGPAKPPVAPLPEPGPKPQAPPATPRPEPEVRPIPQPTAPAVGEEKLRFVKGLVPIAAGAEHAVAIAANGTAWAWGRHRSGQLGFEADKYGEVKEPKPVSFLEGAIAVAAGEVHTAVLKSDGTVWTWGNGLSGQLGIRSFGAPFARQALPESQERFGYVACGRLHTLAITREGVVRTWGDDSQGQLGVNGMDRAVAVAGGKAHSLVLRADGTVWGVGLNRFGELGDGTTNNRASPVKVRLPGPIQAIAAGETMSMALDRDGRVWVWGMDIGRRRYDVEPVAVTSVPESIAIAVGGLHRMALTREGTVWTWGTLDLVGRESPDYGKSPAPVTTLTHVVAITAGEHHSLAVRRDGTVWQWGPAQERYNPGDAKRPVNRVPIDLTSRTPAGGLSGPAKRPEPEPRKAYPSGSPGAVATVFADAFAKGDSKAVVALIEPGTLDPKAGTPGKKSEWETMYEDSKKTALARGPLDASYENFEVWLVSLFRGLTVGSSLALAVGEFQPAVVLEPVLEGADLARTTVVWPHDVLTMGREIVLHRSGGQWRLRGLEIPTVGKYEGGKFTPNP